MSAEYDGGDVIQRGLNIPIDIQIWMDREYIPTGPPIGIDWEKSEITKLRRMVTLDLLGEGYTEGDTFDRLITLIEQAINARCGVHGLLVLAVPSGHRYRVYLIPQGTQAVNMLIDILRGLDVCKLR